MIVSLYAACLGILLVILSLRVIALRGNPLFKWFAFGYNDKKALERSIRAHGNLIEYAPLFIIILMLCEMGGLSASTVHYYGAVFLLGRVLHGICFGFLKQSMILRIAGTALTLFPLLGVSVQLLLQVI